MLQQRQQQLVESEAVTQEQVAELLQSCERQKGRLLPTVGDGNANLTPGDSIASTEYPIRALSLFRPMKEQQRVGKMPGIYDSASPTVYERGE
jgi:hypothetical protein